MSNGVKIFDLVDELEENLRHKDETVYIRVHVLCQLQEKYGFGEEIKQTILERYLDRKFN